MRFYRVHDYEAVNGSHGYLWFTSKAEAEKKARELVAADPETYDEPLEIEALEVEPTKVGILEALNRYAGHPDNG